MPRLQACTPPACDRGGRYAACRQALRPRRRQDQRMWEGRRWSSAPPRAQAKDTRPYPDRLPRAMPERRRTPQNDRKALETKQVEIFSRVLNCRPTESPSLNQDKDSANGHRGRPFAQSMRPPSSASAKRLRRKGPACALLHRPVQAGQLLVGAKMLLFRRWNRRQGPRRADGPR